MSDFEGSSDVAFWRAALAHYGRPGVSEAALELQDEFGVDVMAALWAVAAAEAGRRIAAADVEAFMRATKAARAEAARRRSARRALKGGDARAYEAAKAHELEAERAVADAAPDFRMAGQAARGADGLVMANVGVMTNGAGGPKLLSACRRFAATE